MATRRRTKGTGEVFQEPGGSWACRWREDGRRRYRGGFPSKILADALLAKVRLELAHGRAGLPPDPAGFPTLKVEAAKWIERRKHTHRAWGDDQSRWTTHLEPAFGHLRAHEVDAGRIRAFVEEKLRSGLNPQTVKHCITLLSTFFADLCERPRETGAQANPVRSLPRSTRRLYRPTHRPGDTTFLKTLEDVQRVHAAMREPCASAFALGAFSGLRTGEILGLAWEDVDLQGRTIHVHRQVQESKLVGLKDDEPRTVPILDALLPVLEAHLARGAGQGQLFQPDRPGRRAGKNGTRSRFMLPRTLHNALRSALRACKLPVKMTWYEATKHTFASHWVIGGGSMERLALILGHSSTEVTRRYAHLLPEHLGAQDRARLPVQLNVGQSLASEPSGPKRENARKRMSA